MCIAAKISSGYIWSSVVPDLCKSLFYMILLHVEFGIDEDIVDPIRDPMRDPRTEPRTDNKGLPVLWFTTHP